VGCKSLEVAGVEGVLVGASGRDRTYNLLIRRLVIAQWKRLDRNDAAKA
jgi:hypothetical protein